MRGKATRLWIILFSYVTGAVTSYLFFHVFFCTTSQLDVTRPFRRPPHRIYVRNELYNSRGLLNEGPEDKTDARDDFDDVDHCMKLWRKYNKGNVMTDEERAGKAKGTDSDTGKVFINCGGTFPWSVELFLDTYPRAELFKIHSFIKDKSYGVMYKKFGNHTLHVVEASSKNDTVNEDIKCFGCGYLVTQKIEKLDIAEWIMRNTKKDDFVIVRVESDEERELVERFAKLKVYDHIDKYYTTSTDPQFLKYADKELGERSKYTVVQSWDTMNQTYSDFLTINPKSVPVKGNFVDKCLDTNSTENFALFLYSVNVTTNVLKVIEMIHQFSPGHIVPATAFLPFQFFNTNWDSNVFKTLFETFQAGLYYSPSVSLDYSAAVGRARELSLRNAAVTVQKVFQDHKSYMQNIMYSKEVNNDTLVKAMDEYNYIFFAQGIDITHLINTVLNGETVTMDMTGWTEGQYLMINMDVKYSEYLVLYMLRRFAPWLLDVFQCSMPKPAWVSFK